MTHQNRIVVTMCLDITGEPICASARKINKAIFSFIDDYQGKEKIYKCWMTHDVRFCYNNNSGVENVLPLILINLAWLRRKTGCLCLAVPVVPTRSFRCLRIVAVPL